MRFILIVLCSLFYAHSQPAFARQMATQNTYHPVYMGHSVMQYAFEGRLKANPSQVIHFTSGIYAGEDSATYVRLDDEKMFDFSKDDSLKKYTGDFDTLTALVISYDSVGAGDTLRFPAIVHSREWIFSKIQGKISLFTLMPNSDEFDFMKVESPDTVPYDKDFVTAKLEGNPAASTLLVDRDIGYTISILMVVGGVILAGVGLENSDHVTTDSYGQQQHEFSASPLIAVGAGMLLTSWIPYLVVKGNYVKAVYQYNF